MFDRNKDGFIDRTELKRVANLLGTMLSKEEVEDFMSQADIVSFLSTLKLFSFHVEVVKLL